jgi:hypothetical protein
MQNTNHLRAKSNPRRGKSVLREKPMKNQYDFSKADRGKFYHADSTFSFPVYLEPDVDEFMSKLADEKETDVQDLVNAWLRASMNLVRSIR